MIYDFNNTTDNYAKELLDKYSKGQDDYNKEAIKFLYDTKTTLKISFSHKGKHFDGDTQARNIYTVLLTNANHSYRFNFGDSINNTEKLEHWKTKLSQRHKYKPNAYSILACLQVNYCDTFEDFCNEFGYEGCDPDNFDGNFINESTMRTFRAVQEETENLKQLFTEQQLEDLHEIS